MKLTRTVLGARKKTGDADIECGQPNSTFRDIWTWVQILGDLDLQSFNLSPHILIHKISTSQAKKIM